jgi:hypothetical protein
MMIIKEHTEIKVSTRTEINIRTEISEIKNRKIIEKIKSKAKLQNPFLVSTGRESLLDK